MQTLRFDLSKSYGKMKILNATNGGPWHRRGAIDQLRSNFDDYKAARIPYSRNHDSGVLGVYGGPFSHDITRIFTDFNADVNDPESYDFACTDESILATLAAGTETFFRLGQTIEHQIKKHGTVAPPDFEKWAQICEHIIMHYNYGWANGFELGIKYWEIWNEPDLDEDDSKNKRTWGGTKAQFFDLYEITAKRLKARFPELKIGGPAIAFRLDWADDFLREMKKREVSIDFFSWHIYCTEPSAIVKRAEAVRALLDKHGYEKTESILNEFNYIKGWTDDYVYSIKQIHGIKGATFLMADICTAAKTSIDMLMYYDTRPSLFNGAFDYYTLEKLKGYYPLYWYGMFYDMECEVRCDSEPENIYTLCAKNKEGKILCTVTNYSDNDNAPEKEVSLDFGRGGKYEVYFLDNENDPEIPVVTEDLTFVLKNQTVVFIKEI